jgi:hypothetical protein
MPGVGAGHFLCCKRRDHAPPSSTPFKSDFAETKLLFFASFALIVIVCGDVPMMKWN